MKKLLLLIIVFISSWCFSQEVNEKKEIALQIETFLKEKKYSEANNKIDFLIENSSLNPNEDNPKYKLSDYGKKYFVNQKSIITTKLKDYNTAIHYLKELISLGGLNETAYGSRYHRFDLAKLYLKIDSLDLACNELSIISNYIYDYDGRHKKKHLKALKLKDSLCTKYLAQEEFKRKKLENPHYGNQAPALSLLGAYKVDVNSILGNSSGKVLEHRGKDSYDAFIYKTKWGEYRIAYKNSRVFLIWLYPSIKQKFNEDKLWLGGKFNIENNDKFIFDGCTGNDEKGFINKLNYYSIVYDCNSAIHSITFYGKKDGNVTQVFIY